MLMGVHGRRVIVGVLRGRSVIVAVAPKAVVMMVSVRVFMARHATP
jgi:uncharacterized membrane protein YcjF (UPF0283 family)